MGDVRRIEREGVIELQLARIEKKNALTAAMYRMLIEGLEEASRRDDITAVLLSGEGEAFSAGNDIKDFLSPGGIEAAMAFIHAIAAFDKPIVAAVQGLAVGIGTTMLLHCDLVYAAPDARFSVPFVKLGLVPEAASSLLLPARIGHAKAAAMLLLGEPLDAFAAERAGLVTSIVEEGVLEHARAQAAALTRLPAGALFTTRRLMKGERAAVERQMAAEELALQAAVQSDDAKEAFTAFLEKRPPNFAR